VEDGTTGEGQDDPSDEIRVGLPICFSCESSFWKKAKLQSERERLVVGQRSPYWSRTTLFYAERMKSMTTQQSHRHSPPRSIDRSVENEPSNRCSPIEYYIIVEIILSTAVLKRRIIYYYGAAFSICEL